MGACRPRRSARGWRTRAATIIAAGAWPVGDRDVPRRDPDSHPQRCRHLPTSHAACGPAGAKGLAKPGADKSAAWSAKLVRGRRQTLINGDVQGFEEAIVDVQNQWHRQHVRVPSPELHSVFFGTNDAVALAE